MNEKVFGVYLTRNYDQNQWCSNFAHNYIDTYDNMLHSFNYFVEKNTDNRLKYEIRKHIGNNYCHKNRLNECCVGIAITFDKKEIKELIKRLEL